MFDVQLDYTAELSNAKNRPWSADTPTLAQLYKQSPFCINRLPYLWTVTVYISKLGTQVWRVGVRLFHRSRSLKHLMSAIIHNSRSTKLSRPLLHCQTAIENCELTNIWRFSILFLLISLAVEESCREMQSEKVTNWLVFITVIYIQPHVKSVNTHDLPLLIESFTLIPRLMLFSDVVDTRLASYSAVPSLSDKMVLMNVSYLTLPSASSWPSRRTSQSFWESFSPNWVRTWRSSVAETLN